MAVALTVWIVHAGIAFAHQQSASAAKILHFPADHCQGSLYVEHSPDPARPDPIHLALPQPTDPTENAEFLGLPQGDVVVPADGKVCLFFTESSPADLSGLVRLDANDLFWLGVSSLVTADNADDRILKPASRLAALQVLSLNHTGVTDRGIRYLNELRSLRALDLTGESRIDDGGLAVMALPALQYLDCDTGITDAGLKYLRRLSGLRWLRLRTGRIQGPGLADLAYVPNLERLCLWGDTGLTDYHVSYLQNLTHLKGLTIWGEFPLTNACLEYIGRLTELEDLTFIQVSTLTGEGAAYLKGLRHLKRVDFGQSRVSDEGIRHLTALPSLESILNIGATSKGLAMLSSFPALRCLQVRWMGPGSESSLVQDTGQANRPAGEPPLSGVRRLATLKSLEELTLYASDELPQEDRLFLASLTCLKRLSLRGDCLEQGPRP